MIYIRPNFPKENQALLPEKCSIKVPKGLIRLKQLKWLNGGLEEAFKTIYIIQFSKSFKGL